MPLDHGHLQTLLIESIGQCRAGLFGADHNRIVSSRHQNPPIGLLSLPLFGCVIMIVSLPCPVNRNPLTAQRHSKAISVDQPNLDRYDALII